MEQSGGWAGETVKVVVMVKQKEERKAKEGDGRSHSISFSLEVFILNRSRRQVLGNLSRPRKRTPSALSHWILLFARD